MGNSWRWCITIAAAVYLVSLNGLFHKLCPGNCMHSTSRETLWWLHSCSEYCSRATVQTLFRQPFYSKFLLWVLLCSWKEMTDREVKLDKWGCHQTGSWGFSKWARKDIHLPWVIRNNLWPRRVMVDSDVCILNTSSFLLKLFLWERANMSGTVWISCSSNIRDVSVFFFMLKERSLYSKVDTEVYQVTALIIKPIN